MVDDVGGNFSVLASAKRAIRNNGPELPDLILPHRSKLQSIQNVNTLTFSFILLDCTIAGEVEKLYRDNIV
jgi:hypothetical protein